MELDTAFDEALENVQMLPGQPTHVQLKLYGLFKQSTVGDVTGARPGVTNFRGRAKYDAWASQKGLPTDEAKMHYIEYAEELGA
jgi:acyl-CoA-binding protein